jgi:hypothetical protein
VGVELLWRAEEPDRFTLRVVDGFLVTPAFEGAEFIVESQ